MLYLSRAIVQLARANIGDEGERRRPEGIRNVELIENLPKTYTDNPRELPLLWSTNVW